MYTTCLPIEGRTDPEALTTFCEFSFRSLVPTSAYLPTYWQCWVRGRQIILDRVFLDAQDTRLPRVNRPRDAGTSPIQITPGVLGPLSYFPLIFRALITGRTFSQSTRITSRSDVYSKNRSTQPVPFRCIATPRSRRRLINGRRRGWLRLRRQLARKTSFDLCGFSVARFTGVPLEYTFQ